MTCFNACRALRRGKQTALVLWSDRLPEVEPAIHKNTKVADVDLHSAYNTRKSLAVSYNISCLEKKYHHLGSFRQESANSRWGIFVTVINCVRWWGALSWHMLLLNLFNLF